MTCDRCGKVLALGEWPFCGGVNSHGFPLAGLSIIDDEIEGGPRFFDTMGPEDVWISSKSEWRREVKARGLVNVDKHDRAYYQRRFRMHDEEKRDTGMNREY